MSSPYINPNTDYTERCLASPPPVDLPSPQESMESSIRPMRLKVLYTFDSENRTNCLARWPQILNIRTAHLDETTQIGVIELRTCLEAIVVASPEMTAKLGQDYTVYAYDYSEYETPLVGQGMLSWALASASPTPSAPAHQSSTIVTGRVCKNILGLFGHGIQETLEVKLRLVPVPTCLQSEYVESMRRYRDFSQSMHQGIDPQTWAESLKANPAGMSVAQSRSQSPASAIGLSQHGLERVQQLVNEGYGPSGFTSNEVHQRRDSRAKSILNGHETVRLGSPALSLQSMATTQRAHSHRDQHSRAASTASNLRTRVQMRRMSTASGSDAGYLSSEDWREEGPPMKRAKVFRTDHPGKSALGRSADSLRVTASAAASIRVFQPTAVRPTATNVSSLEGPPRVPTPVPQQTVRARRPALPATRSNLGESLITSDSGYRSQYPNSDHVSPEKRRASSIVNSPEPGSSPPVIREVSAAPSSPVLPALPHQASARFHSEPFDDLIESSGEMHPFLSNAGDHAGTELGHIRQSDIATFQAPSEAPIEKSGTEEAFECKMDEEAKRKELSMRNARKAVGLKRSQTWAGEQVKSDPPPASKRLIASRAAATGSKARGGWNKEKRKQAIQNKLESSIQAGEMPPFCENCGAIETPIWRKAYSRVHSGDHSQVRLSTEDGGIVAIQVMETYDDGSTKLFKIFKKSRSDDEDDEGFSGVLLCNPCGIWLSNRRAMRPPSLWGKDKTKNEAGKHKSRRSRAKRKSESERDCSGILNVPSEAMTLASDMSSAPLVDDTPSEQRNDRKTCSSATNTSNSTQVNPSQLLSPRKHRSTIDGEGPADSDNTSNAAIDPSALLALQRAIESSPGQKSFLGSKQSPIEVDNASPEPTRRTLFPSPRTHGALGVSTADKLNQSRHSIKKPNETSEQANSTTDQVDKENHPPRPTTPHNGLEDLFSGFSPLTPSRTPTNLLKSPSQLLKTPLHRSSPSQRPLATGDFFSSAAKVFLHPPRTPTRPPTTGSMSVGNDMTPFTMHLNQLLSENAVTSPNAMLSQMDSLPALALGIEGSGRPGIADGGTPSRMFRTADFDFAAFASSDLPVPSSPPSWFGVYEEPAGHEDWAPDGEQRKDQHTSAEVGNQEPGEMDVEVHEFENSRIAVVEPDAKAA